MGGDRVLPRVQCGEPTMLDLYWRRTDERPKIGIVDDCAHGIRGKDGGVPLMGSVRFISAVVFDAFDAALVAQVGLVRSTGARDNYIELRRLVTIIEGINWSTVPRENSNRGRLRKEKSPGRQATSAGDFVWYDPWASEMISADRARELRADPYHLPAGHPTGYVFEPEWAPREERMDETINVEQDAQGGMDLERFARRSGDYPARGAATSDIRRSSDNPVLTTLGVHSRDSTTGTDALCSVQAFLREVGLPASELSQGWAGLRSSVRRRLAGPDNQVRSGDQTHVEAMAVAGSTHEANESSNTVARLESARDTQQAVALSPKGDALPNDVTSTGTPDYIEES